jgi:hypothetical protein
MGMTLPLEFDGGHLFMRMGEQAWLVDTGAPQGFGRTDAISLDGMSFPVQREFMGLDADVLSGLVNRPTHGLLGADVLNELDMRLDVARSVVELSRSGLDVEGESLPLTFVMGVPVVTAEIDGEAMSMFFDTGAQVSYWQGEGLDQHEPAGMLSDFYPGFGAFETETFTVPVALGTRSFTLRCGQLPPLLGMTLMMAGSSGIIGNEVLLSRTACYMARRSRLVLS